MSETITSQPSITARQRAISMLKWLWMIVVLLGFVFYVYSNYAVITTQLQLVSPLTIVYSLLLIALGRICIIIMTREVLVSFDHRLPLRNVFYIVSTSDLAKYLPGGIWHFVGRAAYYKTTGLSVSRVSQAILKENLWLIVSAGFTSAMLLILGYTGYQFWWLMLIMIVIWLVVIYLWGRHVDWRRIIGVVLLQFIIWLMIGLSFSLILPISTAAPNIMIAAGAFTISWLIGFISLFAPGGIGVREAILVAFLLPLLASSDSAVFAVTHRLLWIAIEFLFGLIAWVFFDLDIG